MDNVVEAYVKPRPASRVDLPAWSRRSRIPFICWRSQRLKAVAGPVDEEAQRPPLREAVRKMPMTSKESQVNHPPNLKCARPSVFLYPPPDRHPLWREQFSRPMDALREIGGLRGLRPERSP